MRKIIQLVSQNREKLTSGCDKRRLHPLGKAAIYTDIRNHPEI